MAHVMREMKFKPLSELESSDSLFGIGKNGPEDSEESRVVEIPLTELHEFEGHPFRVLDDESMRVLVESIKQSGVKQPGLARKRAGGGYEIIEGHRRRHASELAGLKTMPFRIEELSDDEATIYMAASNLCQRKEFLPSEKAWAYRKLYDAMKHQGKKGTDTAEMIGEESGDSAKTVKRYMRLTELVPGLLDMVDLKRLGLEQGYTISFLEKKDQDAVLGYITDNAVMNVTMGQAQELREYGERRELNTDVLDLIFKREKIRKRSFSMKQEKLDRYFTPDYSEKEIEEIIFLLLDEWKRGMET